jgi:hypothetical protein
MPKVAAVPAAVMVVEEAARRSPRANDAAVPATVNAVVTASSAV